MTIGTLKVSVALALAAAAALAMGACGGSVTAGGSAACDEVRWNQPKAKSVACPGAETCSCGAGQVCCAVPSSDGNSAEAASCSAPSACKDVALACDGPEDCDAGNVCCLSAAGAACLPEADCHSQRVCHADADCPSFQQCEPGLADSFLGDTTAVCN